MLLALSSVFQATLPFSLHTNPASFGLTGLNANHLYRGIDVVGGMDVVGGDTQSGRKSF